MTLHLNQSWAHFTCHLPEPRYPQTEFKYHLTTDTWADGSGQAASWASYHAIPRLGSCGSWLYYRQESRQAKRPEGFKGDDMQRSHGSRGKTKMTKSRRLRTQASKVTCKDPWRLAGGCAVHSRDGAPARRSRRLEDRRHTHGNPLIHSTIGGPDAGHHLDQFAASDRRPPWGLYGEDHLQRGRGAAVLKLEPVGTAVLIRRLPGRSYSGFTCYLLLYFRLWASALESQPVNAGRVSVGR